MNNRHMNIFHHYSHTGTIPYENNLSRGLAILLNEYPAILFLLLEKIKEKSDNIEISIPKNSYEVGFQKRINSFYEVEKIVGVALTAMDLETNGQEDNSGYTGAEVPITDISIIYDNTLIIIEVKRDMSDCVQQLNDQIKKCKKYIKNTMEIDAEHVIASLSWTNIIEVLDQYRSINSNKPDVLIDDYYDELSFHHPEWLPIERLNLLDINERNRIELRLNAIKNEYLKLNNNDAELIYDRKAIPINWDYASECNIWMMDNFNDDIGENNTYLCIGIWPADTCTQYWNLKNKSNFSFVDSRFSSVVIPGYGELKVRIEPYIKLCHFNKGISNVYMTYTDDMTGKIDNLAMKITGRKSREKWDACIEAVKNSGLISENEFNKFVNMFTEKFVRTNRNYVVFSIGFEIYAYMDFNEAKEIDKKNNSVGLVDIIDGFLNEMKKK